MNLPSKLRLSSLIFFVLISSACVTSTGSNSVVDANKQLERLKVASTRSALCKHQPSSIMVLPPTNASMNTKAPYIFLSAISKPLAERGYYVFPVSLVDNFFRANSIDSSQEINIAVLNKIREHTGADAVLLSTIGEWGQVFVGINSVTVVDVKMKIVDTQTGITLWRGKAQKIKEAKSSKEEDDHHRIRHHDNSEEEEEEESGIIATILKEVLSAIFWQIVKSPFADDNTRDLSAEALAETIETLLPGPYKIDKDASPEAQANMGTNLSAKPSICATYAQSASNNIKAKAQSSSLPREAPASP